MVEGTPSAITTTTTTTVTSPPGPTNPTQGVSYLPISLVGVNSQGQTTYVQNVVKHFAVKTFYESDYHPLTGTQTANPPVYTYTLNFEDPITSQRKFFKTISSSLSFSIPRVLTMCCGA